MLFWITAALVLFAGLGIPSLRGSEDRFAEITREMVQSGDYLRPRLNGEPHFHKPLLSYWAIAAASEATGRLTELAARLPSAVAAIIALAATIRLGAALWGAAVGRLAGWLLLGSYGFLFWARTAAADMENLAAVILAVAWFRLREHRPTLSLYLVFGLVCAVGAQAKGLAAIALPVVVLAPHLLRHRRWREHVQPGPLALSLVAAGGVYLAPFLLGEWERGGLSVFDAFRAGDPESGLYMVFQENVRRFYAPHDHRGSVFTYAGALPVLLLPWSLVFFASLGDCVRDRLRIDPETKWILWAVAIVFALFTLSGSRRSYYILPILPFCTLLMSAVLVAETRASMTAVALRWTTRALLGAAFLEAAAAVAMVPAGWALGVEVSVSLVLATAGIAVATACLYARGVRQRASATLIAVPLSMVLLGGYFVLQYPELDGFRTEKPFALKLRTEAQKMAPRRVAFVRHVPALFPFYMGAASPVPVLRDSRSAREFAEAGEGLIVASPRTLRSVADLAVFGRPPEFQEELFPWSPVEERLGAWRVGVLPMDTGE